MFIALMLPQAAQLGSKNAFLVTSRNVFMDSLLMQGNNKKRSKKGSVQQD